MISPPGLTTTLAPGVYQGPNYYLGVDLGQAADWSCMVILERSSQSSKPHYRVVYIKRWPLRTEYGDIARSIAARAARPELRPLSEMADTFVGGVPRAPAPVLVIDATGVGRAVVELVAEQVARLAREGVPVAFRPLVITGGNETREAWWGDTRGTMAYWTPKQELVGTLQALLGTSRLTVPAGLEHAGILKKELQDFRVKQTKAGHETYAAREGEHDDLVLSLAMAAWVAERPVATDGWGPDPTAFDFKPAAAKATTTRRGFGSMWR